MILFRNRWVLPIVALLVGGVVGGYIGSSTTTSDADSGAGVKQQVRAAAASKATGRPGIVRQRPGAGRPTTRRSGRRRGPRVARVVLAKVELRTIGNRVAAVGTGRAQRSLTLTANVTGVIEQVLFSAGQNVKSGQALIKLQSEAEQIAVRLTQVKVRDAQATVARYEQLSANRAGTRVQLEQARTALATAKAELDAKKFDLKQRTILAPFDGVMGITTLVAGDFLKEGTAIATIDDRSKIIVDFVVSERVASQLKLGNSVRLATPALTGRVFRGTVVALDTRIEPASRTLRVQASVPNDEGRLISGMTFSVSLRIEGRKLPSMPGLAIQWDRKGAFVWRVDAAKKASRVAVTIRRRENDTVSVEGKLKAGDQVVIEGQQNVRQGMTVMPAQDG